MKPVFSIIMPTYNRAFCITNAIDSLLAQEYKNWELIIIDDGSTDNTEELIRKKYSKYLTTKQIQYIKSTHLGVSKARNLGLKQAKYDWIGYLDTDNTLVTDYLETFVQAIQDNPETELFYAQIKVGNRISGRNFDRRILEKGNFIDLGALVHQRGLVKEFGGFNEHLKRAVDWELVLRYTQKKTPIFIPKTILNYNNSDEISRISNSEDLKQARKKIQKLHHLPTEKGNQNMFLLKLAKFLHIISSKKYKELRAIKQFQQSNLFDGEWYLKTYPDVANSKMSPEKHYYKYGWKEGRNPSPLFNGNVYLNENWDVKDSGKNPLEHYLISGQYEGRYYTSINGKVDSQSVESTHHSPKEHLNLMKKIRYALEYPIRLQEECERLKAEINELEK